MGVAVQDCSAGRLYACLPDKQPLTTSLQFLIIIIDNNPQYTCHAIVKLRMQIRSPLLTKLAYVARRTYHCIGRSVSFPLAAASIPYQIKNTPVNNMKNLLH